MAKGLTLYMVKAVFNGRADDLVDVSRSNLCFFFSSRRRHTRSLCDWSSDVCSSDLVDRGNCNFIVKVKNAQNAGAVGVIVVNNDTANPTAVIAMGGGDPTITIPTVKIGRASCRERV